jgi:hypothetical protein
MDPLRSLGQQRLHLLILLFSPTFLYPSGDGNHIFLLSFFSRGSIASHRDPGTGISGVPRA